MNTSQPSLRLEKPENWIISKIILNQFKSNPDFEIIEFVDHEKWTFKELISLGLKVSDNIIINLLI